MTAVNNVNLNIRDALVGGSVIEQAVLDQRMLDLDGTDNKSNLGANAILAVSLAISKAAANHLGIPLYSHISNLSGNKRNLTLQCQ